MPKTIQLSNHEQKENLKVKYKNQRLEQAKQVYLCECQKVYLSFPALYVHVKNKHKIKLTTKINNKICKIEQKNGKTFITYFLIDYHENQDLAEEKNSYQSQEDKRMAKTDVVNTSKLLGYHKDILNEERGCVDANTSQDEESDKNVNEEIKEVMRQFLRQAAYQEPYFCEEQARILGLLIVYIEKCCQNSQQFYQINKSQPWSILYNLPLFFNQFTCVFLPSYFAEKAEERTDKWKQIKTLKNFGKWLRLKGLTNLMVVNSI